MEGRELPVGWVQVPIGDLCELRNGRAFKPAEWTDEGIPIVRIQNLNNGQAKFNHFQGEVDANHLLSGGELLFAWSGTPGTSFGAHIWEGGKAALNQHIFRVDFDEGSLQKGFFRYAINQKLNDLIDIAHGGVGLRHVTKGKFEHTEVCLPPLKEQRRIAAKLDTTLAAVDACRQRLDGVAVILKRFRQAMLAAATSGELTREWREERGVEEPKMHPLGEIIKVSSGKFLPAKAMVASGGVPVYGGNGVNGFHNESNVHEPTLVIGRVGYYCGSVHLTSDKAWVTDNALLVRHDIASTRQKYLYYALQAIDLRANDSSTAQPVISGSKIYPLRLMCPSVEEQDEIVERLETLFALADQLEARLTAARKVVDRLTPALLAKAFRGELVPQDPADEPASVLLKRIRAARQAEAGAARPSRRGRPKAAANPEPIDRTAAPAPSDPLPPDLLSQLLRECGALSERALLAASELGPEGFFTQLERELQLGLIRQSREDGQVLLEAVA